MSLLRRRRPGPVLEEALVNGEPALVRTFPGFAAECHPDRPEAREGKCRECLAVERIHKSGQKQIAASVEEASAIATILASEAVYVDELLVEAKRIIQERLPDYARLHFEAATEAAAKGDSRPAEWAMERITGDRVEKGKAIAPAKKEPEGNNGGVKILIGVQLGGSQIPSTHTVDVEEVDDGESGL